MPADVHPARIAACFSDAVPEALIATLRGEARFADRLAALLSDRFDLGEDGEGLDGADAAIASLESAALDDLGLRAGAILHAGAFLREIRGPVLAALAERFGQEALADARRHRDLAVDRPAAADLDAFEIAVREDGRACVGAWIAALPAATRRRLRLRWPSEDAVPTTSDPQILRNGPQILRRLVAQGDGS